MPTGFGLAEQSQCLSAARTRPRHTCKSRRVAHVFLPEGKSRPTGAWGVAAIGSGICSHNMPDFTQVSPAPPPSNGKANVM